MTDTPSEDPSPGVGELLRESLGGIFRMPHLGARGFALLAGLIALGWLSTSLYRVQPDEQGVVLRFGKWVDTTGPGLHVHWPYPIDAALFPKVTKVNQVQLGNLSAAAGDPVAGRERQMLTGDENIVEADCAVFWKIRDAGQFLFKVDAPETAVKIAAEGALRDVISRMPIQSAMSDKRQQIADETRALLQQLLDREQSGIEITQVQLQRVEPPLAVIDAFNDVQRARADQERARNEAEAYAKDILPRARGEAEHTRQDAEAYRTSVVNIAKGEANAFLAELAAYKASPQVTAWRLYLEAVDEVLKKSQRVVIDTSGKGAAGVTPYLSIGDPRPVQRAYVPPPPSVIETPSGTQGPIPPPGSMPQMRPPGAPK